MTLHHRLGILFAGRRYPDAFPQVDVAVLLTLAEHLATGVENLRLTCPQWLYQLLRESEVHG